MTKNVYVIEPVRMEIDAARAFGEMRYAYTRNRRDELRPSMWHPDYAASVADRLCTLGYRPGTDYFLLVGGIVPVASVIAELVVRDGHVRCLAYDPYERLYVERVLGEAPVAIAASSEGE